MEIEGDFQSCNAMWEYTIFLAFAIGLFRLD